MSLDIDVQNILKHLREIIGTQGQEIAMLKALNDALQEQLASYGTENPENKE